MSLRVLDLFSGVGAYSLGLERAGMRTVAFCEINAYCRRILAQHWPNVPIFEDVHDVTADSLARRRIAVDVIVGGWPCQDISIAGSGYGLDGARSGLWSEIARILGDVRPRWAVMENSSNLLAINGGRDFGRVLGDLASLGYDAEWHCLPAAAFDAPHIRDRLWIVALAANPDGSRFEERRRPKPVSARHDPPKRTGETAADPDNQRKLQPEGRKPHEWRRAGNSRTEPEGDVCGRPHIGAAIARAARQEWEPEPGVARVVPRAPNRVDRIRALGNLNPPIVPEMIGRAIMEAVDGEPIGGLFRAPEK